MKRKRWPRAGETCLPRRGGMTLFEILAAAAVLGVLLVACGQMLAAMTIQQRAIRNRRAALQMVQNAMERAFTLPWGRSGEEEAEKMAAEIAAQGMLRGARVEIALESAPARRDEQTIRVAVAWREGREETERVERLTAWRYRTGRPEEVAAPPEASQPQRGKP